jgi:tetratricopeptide (TPR) repeat protein
LFLASFFSYQKESIMTRSTSRRPLLWLAFFTFLIPSVLASPNQFRGLPISSLSPQQLTNLEAGFAALEQNKMMSAHRLFSQLIEQQPDKPVSWIALGWTATSAEEFARASKMSAQLKTQATVAEKILSEIQATYISGDAEQRISLAQSLVKQFPNSSLAWWVNGNVLSSVQQNDEARVAFDKVINLAPMDALGYMAAGNSLLFSEPRDLQKAEQMFLKVTHLQPANTNAHIALGDARRAQNKLDLALEDYTRASLLEPQNGTAFTKKGHVNTFLGHYDKAQQDYQTAIQVAEPAGAMYLGNYKAFTYIYQNQPELSVKALKDWLAYIDTLPIEDHQKVQGKLFTTNNLALIQMHIGQLDKVAETLKQREALIERQISQVDDKLFNRVQRANIHFFRGYLQAHQGNLTVAADTADKMQQLLIPVKDPRKLENYHELMGFISLKSENWDKAVAHYNKADQEKVYVKYHKAIALEQKGDKKAAYNLYREVRDYNFNSVDYALIREDAKKKTQMMTALASAQ